MKDRLQIAIIGGGAAGFFCALRAGELAKERSLPVDIQILENSSAILKKVRISGGGRCNVTHHCFDPREFVKNYPRGHKELLSPFQKFQALDTVDWFKSRGVNLVPEEDGRMFPNTNTSETIIQCFLTEAQKHQVSVLTQRGVTDLQSTGPQKFNLQLTDGSSFSADRVLLATGSSPAGYQLASKLGHTITDLAPSLFSFKIEDKLLKDLSGLSFPNASLKLQIKEGKDFRQNGPLLITHWGLSGPAILKLSAWAAREMKICDYKASLYVNWLGADRRETAQEILTDLKTQNPKSQLKNIYPQEIPRRFWLQLLAATHIQEDSLWANFSKKHLQDLSENLFAYRLEILGKNRFKDEFVECGGVSLKEVDFKSMQSKLHPSLYFAGELLDIDGITGGFNFQNAWTTGWIAGTHMIESAFNS